MATVHEIEQHAASVLSVYRTLNAVADMMADELAKVDPNSIDDLKVFIVTMTAFLIQGTTAAGEKLREIKVELDKADAEVAKIRESFTD